MAGRGVRGRRSRLALALVAAQLLLGGVVLEASTDPVPASAADRARPAPDLRDDPLAEREAEVRALLAGIPAPRPQQP